MKSRIQLISWGWLSLGLFGAAPGQRLLAEESTAPTKVQASGISIGILDQRVLFQESQQIKLLKSRESLELHAIQKKIEDNQRNINKLQNQLQTLTSYSRLDQAKRREELLKIELNQFRAQMEEHQKKKVECTEETLAEINELIQSWVKKVLESEGLELDLVLFRGVGPFLQEGAVAYYSPESKLIFDLTPKVVDWALKSWSESGELEEVESSEATSNL